MTVTHVVRVSSSAMTNIHAAATSALPNETGGILLGFRAAEGVVVTRALVVHDARSTGHDYVRNEVLATKALATARADAPPIVGYVGEWHTHTADQPPSRTDVATLIDIAGSHCDVVAMLVLPFAARCPRPAHAMLSALVPSRALFRRRRAASFPAQLIVDDRSTEGLEQTAQMQAAQAKEEDET